MNQVQDGLRLVEPTHIADTYISGLGEIEDIGGGCLRFVLFSRDHERCTVAAKFIMPRDAVWPAILLAARALGTALVIRDKFTSETTH